MRTILITQSLIILIGAYYIYTLSQIPAPTPETKILTSPTSTEPNVKSTTVDSSTEMSATSSSSTMDISATNTLPNDAGMEYPIPN